jgi:pimeloyl-ACP methyl ester carboxylesterase
MNYHFRHENMNFDDCDRSEIKGNFIALSDGITHFEFAGSQGAPPIVLVHGFSVPSYIWDPTFKALVNAGFRSIRYDLYGRGYSDKPYIKYDEFLFERQLADLLSALEIPTPVDLIGLSMGGFIAALFTLDNPHKVRRLCLISPTGFQRKQSFKQKLIQAPLIGEILFDLFEEKMILATQKDDFYCPERFPDYLEKYIPQMQYQGFKAALLSTLRNKVMFDKLEVYKRVGRMNLPILMVWGRMDQTNPFHLSQKAIEVMPNVVFHDIEKVRHLPHYECPEIVNPLLLKFFGE